MRRQSSIAILVLVLIAYHQAFTQHRPNILWITIEDLTPMLGCYGDPVAHTPSIDQLADQGVRFTNAFATAAVCSPARSSIITGLHACTLGTQHLRSETEIHDSIQGFTSYLREIGYYCSNNGKEDYNFKLADAWDESSKTAHWRNRKGAQPFFSVFNFETTHQSKIFGSDSAYLARFADFHTKITPTDPRSVQLPPYSFDTPEIRKLWARYYDNVQIVDLQIQDLLNQLDEDNLREETIIFFFADHGTGMPRGKRALYDSGTRVPFIIWAPEKYQKIYGLHPGTTQSRLISFVDLAPTILEMLELPTPEIIVGKSFLDLDHEVGSVFATSDRVDEAFECTRSIRTARYRYVRNYYPHRPLIQPNHYSDQSEISKANQKIRQQNYRLTNAQQSMWQVKRPVEELYDVLVDPYEVNNLAGDPYYQKILLKLRQENNAMILRTNDSGFAPEAYMYAVSKEDAPYKVLQNREIFPLPEILELLDQLYFTDVSSHEIENLLHHPHPLIKYWTLIWLEFEDRKYPHLIPTLQEMIDGAPSLVSIAAAGLLAKIDDRSGAIEHLLEIMQSKNPYLLLMATRAFELLPEKSENHLAKGRKIWEMLAQETEGKWRGYDLYAYWSLCQIFQRSVP